MQRDRERKTFTSTKRGRTGQREANAKADAWVASEGVSSSTKVSDLYVKFLEMKKETTSATNYCPMEGRWRLWIEPVIGKKRINKLTSGDMQGAIDHALSKGRSKKFLQNMRTDMSAFLKWCRRHRYRTLNCEDIEVPKAARSGERHILQPRDDDQRQITEPTGSVFCIKNQQTLYKHWQRFCQSNSIQPCSLYELRHTFVSMADSLSDIARVWILTEFIRTQ